MINITGSDGVVMCYLINLVSDYAQTKTKHNGDGNENRGGAGGRGRMGGRYLGAVLYFERNSIRHKR